MTPEESETRSGVTFVRVAHDTWRALVRGVVREDIAFSHEQVVAIVGWLDAERDACVSICEAVDRLGVGSAGAGMCRHAIRNRP